jgi:Flp pilus assembly protein CpaB
MRASTIFALIVAILLGLGAVIAVKASGILTPAEPKKETPPSIVVAAANIFEGNVIQPSDVRLRPVRNAEEMQLLREGKLLPPVTAAAINRIAATDIQADTPLREDLLQPLRGEDLGRQLLPCERAVTVCIAPQYAAAGLVRVGDLVDVQLITSVEGCESGVVNRTALAASQGGNGAGSLANGQPAVQTAATGTQSVSAIVVRGARVIGRRTNRLPVDTPLGRVCCTNYTLAMNPYRAGLTEYVKDKGILALLPVSRTERNALMQQATANLLGAAGRGDGSGDTAVVRKPDNASDDRTVTASYDRSAADASLANPFATCRFSIPGNPEYEDEDKRVADFVAGLYTIGEHDLVRIFRLSCLQPAPVTPPVTVERIDGLTYVGDHVFDPRTGRSAGFMPVMDSARDTYNGKVYPQGVGRTPMVAGTRYVNANGQVTGSATTFKFQPPGASGSGRGGCPTCPTCPKR